ncbi:MAG TPA: four helix bundle protein [Thermodesulfobacteriota bacterium]|nr:four helix bundle protein [Thermodesulfobacteriota bacterium]
MSKIESFEDLFVYQKAREFSRKIAELIKRLPANEKNKLRDQMTRARRSITNNIAEGYGRFHYQENIQYCRQSRGSICEIIDDLIECRDENYIEGKEFSSLKEEAYSLMKILNKYIAYLQKAKKEISN